MSYERFIDVRIRTRADNEKNRIVHELAELLLRLTDEEDLIDWYNIDAHDEEE